MPKKTPATRKNAETVKTETPLDSSVVHCPDCHASINIEGGELGDYFECDTCFAELILSSLQPPKVEMVDEEK